VKKINISSLFLPTKNLFFKYCQDVFERNILTNNGPLFKELNSHLEGRSSLCHAFVSNGTISIQLLLKVLGCKDEVVTTPFS
jgi:dTDP-4-amino-4,6-dideoxygalactose transaminase